MIRESINGRIFDRIKKQNLYTTPRHCEIYTMGPRKTNPQLASAPGWVIDCLPCLLACLLLAWCLAYSGLLCLGLSTRRWPTTGVCWSFCHSARHSHTRALARTCTGKHSHTHTHARKYTYVHTSTHVNPLLSLCLCILPLSFPLHIVKPLQ